MISSARILCALAVIYGSFLAGVLCSNYVHDAEQTAHVAEMQSESIKSKEVWYASFIRRERQSAQELDRIRGQRDADLAGLLERAERAAGTGGETCQGASGRGLARGDANFLVRYGARAAEQQEALKKSYDDYDDLHRLYELLLRRCTPGDLLP